MVTSTDQSGFSLMKRQVWPARSSCDRAEIWQDYLENSPSFLADSAGLLVFSGKMKLVTPARSEGIPSFGGGSQTSHFNWQFHQGLIFTISTWRSGAGGTSQTPERFLLNLPPERVRSRSNVQAGVKDPDNLVLTSSVVGRHVLFAVQSAYRPQNQNMLCTEAD